MQDVLLDAYTFKGTGCLMFKVSTSYSIGLGSSSTLVMTVFPSESELKTDLCICCEKLFHNQAKIINRTFNTKQMEGSTTVVMSL